MQDSKLFISIIKRIFEYTDTKENEEKLLRNRITTVLESNNLKPTELFVNKVIELYKATQTHKGIILLGKSFSGKTKAYQVKYSLKFSILIFFTFYLLRGRSMEKESAFVQVLIHFHIFQMLIEMSKTSDEKIQHCVINPNSMTLEQLYGCLDNETGEWSDGLCLFYLIFATLRNSRTKRFSFVSLFSASKVFSPKFIKNILKVLLHTTNGSYSTV